MTLRFVPLSTGLPSKRCPGIGFFSRVGREIGVFRHVEHPFRSSAADEMRSTGSMRWKDSEFVNLVLPFTMAAVYRSAG